MTITLFEKLQRKYWEVVPHDWRPGWLLYRLKCWLYKRYTTYKPRYLPHTWCDRDVVLAHLCFEVLSRFIEKECSPGCVDWRADEPCNKIELNNGSEKFIIDELMDLYNWWHHRYIPGMNKLVPKLWEQLPDCEINFKGPEFLIFADLESQLKYRSGVHYIHYIERKLEEELNTNLIRLMNVRTCMWT